MRQQICKRCIIGTSVKEVKIKESGECRVCMTHDSLEKQYPSTPKRRENLLTTLVKEIKEKGQKYENIFVELVVDWDNIFSLPIKSFEEYPSYYLMKILRKPIYIATKLGLLPKLLYFKFLG